MFLFLGGLMVGHKPIIGFAVVSVCVLSFNVSTPAQSDFNAPTTQKLVLPQEPALLMPTKVDDKLFSRIREVKIEETMPQLKEHNAKKQLTHAELISVLREAGFSGYGLKMAWAVVQKESTARPFAHNDNAATGDNSYGLFQINMRGSMGPDRREKYGLDSNNDLFDPLTNAEVAFKMSNGGEAWGAWTTHQRAAEIVHQFPG